MSDRQFDWMRETIYEPAPQFERSNPNRRSWFVPAFTVLAILALVCGGLAAIAGAL